MERVFILTRDNTCGCGHKQVLGVYVSFEKAQEQLHLCLQSDIKSFSNSSGYPNISSDVDVDDFWVCYKADYERFSVIYVIEEFTIIK